MTVRVTYNGIDLSDYMEYITDIRRDVGNDDELIRQDTPILGEDLLRVSRGAKLIEVDFTIWSKDRNRVKRELARIFRVDSPKPLVFSDEADKYYLAIKSGKIEMREDVLRRSVGTVTFFVPDGVARSLTYQTVEDVTIANHKLVYHINNRGSEYAYPIVTIKHNADNGYIGLVNQTGALEVGSKLEADGETYQKNVTLFTSNGEFSAWKDSNTFYENPNKKIVTTMTADQQFGGRLGLLPSSFTTSGQTGALQYGACKEVVLSETADNWYIWARAWFETGLMGQTGAWCLTVIDENDHLIAGMAIEKSDTSGNRAQVRFLMGDGKGGSQVMKTIDFTPSYWVRDNPYGSESRDQNRNMFDMVKDSDRIQFFWYGGYYPFNAQALANTRAKRVQFFVGQYANRNTSDRKVTQMFLPYLIFQKLHVDHWRDVPNRYGMGSTVVLNSEDATVMVDNKNRQIDFVYGSRFLEIPPGKSDLEVYVSDWCQKLPTVEVTFEERWL